MTAAPRTAFLVLWPHDGARELQVIIDADLPPYGPLEKRIRGIASVASSHGGLRLLLESAFGGEWTVTVWETVGGATTVRLVPLTAGRGASVNGIQ